MIEFAIQGAGMYDMVMLLIRWILGWFFILARFRWVYDPSRPQNEFLNKERRQHLTWKLCSCGYGRHPVLAGLVAVVEILAGLALVVGLLTVPAALGLAVILLFATWCTAVEKTLRQQPVDRIDCLSCYLWTVEPVYLVLAIALILGGPGAWSLDHYLWEWMR